MSDYTQIGYDQFLSKEPTDKISELDPQAFEQFTTSIIGERITTELAGDLIGQGINANNITAGEMSFDRARGGNLILGGLNNKYGEFALRDEGDADRVIMNKDGIIINEGAINIKDKDNNTMIDADGLTTTNFTNYSVFNNSTRTKNTDDADTGTFTVIPNTSINLIINKPVNVLFMIYIESTFILTAAQKLGLVFGLTIDGTTYPSTTGWGIGNYLDNAGDAVSHIKFNPFSAHCIVKLNTGHYNANLLWKTIYKFGNSISYSVLNTYITALLLGS